MDPVINQAESEALRSADWAWNGRGDAAGREPPRREHTADLLIDGRDVILQAFVGRDQHRLAVSGRAKGESE